MGDRLRSRTYTYVAMSGEGQILVCRRVEIPVPSAFPLVHRQSLAWFLSQPSIRNHLSPKTFLRRTGARREPRLAVHTGQALLAWPGLLNSPLGLVRVWFRVVGVRFDPDLGVVFVRALGAWHLIKVALQAEGSASVDDDQEAQACTPDTQTQWRHRIGKLNEKVQRAKGGS